ncbi:ABC transporter substrate-binding protein [Sorangium cellulosum]|uniref:ABC transporter substrate-binding protein n=1 Tax=Sorangium cellulosum TaxID=56 RepID=A0A2L0EM76_SORCE|nr:ABC transporter substrate-binding protein [Sorangium cellulosum]AUX40395.1 ABC transporter substrate-binding protein [Sorangium cellulosum]
MRDPHTTTPFLITRRLFVAALSAALSLAACSKAEPGGGEGKGDRAAGDYEVLELRYQGFAGVVSVPELAEDLGYLAPIKLSYVGNTISGPQDIQTVVTGDTDFGQAFNGAVIKLIAAGAPLRAVVGGYGVDKERWSGFYVTEDSPIKAPRDLLGKKVAMNTLGAHHESMLKEYLSRQGFTSAEIAQVTLVVLPPVSAEQALRQKQVDVAVLGDILRDKALERGGIRALFSDYELFGEFTAGSYVLTKRFIEQNPNSARKFVEGAARAIEWARSTPRDEVIARFKALVERRGRNEDVSVLKYWHSMGVAGKGGLLSSKEYQIWIDWLVKDGELKEGQIKAEALYTNHLNPFATPVQ